MSWLFPQIYKWRGWKLNAYLFFSGLVEDFCFLFWLHLAARGEIALVVVFVYFWSSIHDSYRAIPAEAWQDKVTRRYEKIGSAIGAGLSLMLFPLT